MTTDFSTIEAAIRAALPNGLAVGAAVVGADNPPLLPEEEAAITRAKPVRRAEFIAGRTAARRALVQLGQEPVAIPRGSDRAPVWPRGVYGSITHDRELALSIVARPDAFLSPGIDIEPLIGLGADERREILTEAENKIAERSGDPSALTLAAFCAKEALYKAQYPLTRQILDFQDVEILMDKNGLGSFVQVHPEVGRASVLQVEADNRLVSLAFCPVSPDARSKEKLPKRSLSFAPRLS